MDVNQILQDEVLAAEARKLLHDPDRAFPVLVAKIKLTWQCNLKCWFCSLWRLPDDGSPPVLPPAGVESLLRGLKTQGLKKVHFSGGEALLRPDFPEILRLTAGLGLQVNLTTNGTLLNREAARAMIEHRVHTVAFSLDAASEKKHDQTRGVAGAWRLTWKGLETLRNKKAQKGRGPVVAVNTVVTRKNIEALPELHELLKQRGIESWRLLPLRTSHKGLRPLAAQWRLMSRTLDSWKPLLARELAGPRSIRDARKAGKGLFAGAAFERHGCYAPWFSLFVDADGRAFPCCTGRRKMPSYGRVGEGSGMEILDSRARREIRASLASGYDFEVCRSCDEFLAENEIFARAIGPRRE
ncbi:MAG: radical SAM protein [Thermodesulfobacteriota bacterium]